MNDRTRATSDEGAPRPARFTSRFPSWPRLRVETLVALVALYVVALGNGPWWSAVTAGRSAGDPSAWLFAAACFVALVALHFVLLVLPSNRWTVKPLLTLVVVATAIAVHYMRAYAVLLDPTMLRNVVRTDVREVRELVSWSSAGQVALWSALPLAVIWGMRVDRRPLLRAIAFRSASIAAALAIATAALLTISRDITSVMRNEPKLRYLITPGNFIVSLMRNAVTDVQVSGLPKAIVGADAHMRTGASDRMRPAVFVLALGETARAANFSLLGYERPTNPELATLDIVAFRNVTACGTSTEVALPCLFSPLGRADYDGKKIRSSEGLLHVLRRAGYAVTWFDNQSGCKGACDGEGIAYRKLGAADAPDLCDGEDCFDEILVRALEAELAEISSNTVIVLHLLGNHGPAYYRRYPPEFRRFTPDCRTGELRECSRDEVVNAYDNAILYTDHILARTIRALGAQAPRLDTALLYVSDHGESLGESGLYLHGLPFAIAPRVQTQVPMVAWTSKEFAGRAAIDPACLAGRANDALSHDNVFHAVLGVLDVATTVYRPDRDVFAPCRTKLTAGR